MDNPSQSPAIPCRHSGATRSSATRVVYGAGQTVVVVVVVVVVVRVVLV